MSELTFPATAVPDCQQAGIYPFDATCTSVYVSTTVALHLHDYHASLTLDGRKLRLEPGDITLSKAGGTSQYALSAKGTHLCIHFHPAKLERHAPRIRLASHLRLGTLTPAARDRIWRIIDHHRRAGSTPASLASRAASAALQELLLWLALSQQRGAVSRRGGRQEEALGRFRTMIDSSLARPASIADLAAGAGLSPAYLARAFARRYGTTVQQYRLRQRIELARHLLLAGDLPVSEIGRRAGLPDPQYFNKQFRRVTGVSPLAYRRGERRTRKAAIARGSRPLP